jgi:hypothetical protein
MLSAIVNVFGGVNEGLRWDLRSLIELVAGYFDREVVCFEVVCFEVVVGGR